MENEEVVLGRPTAGEEREILTMIHVLIGIETKKYIQSRGYVLSDFVRKAIKREIQNIESRRLDTSAGKR